MLTFGIFIQILESVHIMSLENPDFCQLISVLRWKGFLYKQRSRLACSLIVHSKLTVLTPVALNFKAYRPSIHHEAAL